MPATACNTCKPYTTTKPMETTKPHETRSVWPTVTCEAGKECAQVTTTSEKCEVHRITTAGKPVVTTSCKTWTWKPESTLLSQYLLLLQLDLVILELEPSVIEITTNSPEVLAERSPFKASCQRDIKLSTAPFQDTVGWMAVLHQTDRHALCIFVSSTELSVMFTMAGLRFSVTSQARAQHFAFVGSCLSIAESLALHER